jgi:hypothetical protein
MSAEKPCAMVISMKTKRKFSAKISSIHAELNDPELLRRTLLAANAEKYATLILLEYLLEIDIRKLYCQVNACSSLFEYCVRELKLSEPAAAERINAVRLMKSIPEVKSHLQSSRLTLTSAAQIQRFIKTEEKVQLNESSSHDQEAMNIRDPRQKKNIVDICLDQSKREVEKILLSQQSEPAKVIAQEKIKLISFIRSEIKFSVEEKIIAKLNRVKELLGEKSLEAIFDRALDSLISAEEKKRGLRSMEPETKIRTQPAEFKNTVTEEKPAASGRSIPNKKLVPDEKGIRDENLMKSSNSRFISIDLKRMIFTRSNGQCEYIDIKSKRRCSSRYRIEIDHIHPFALGGKTEFTNLRHLCFSHNQRQAMQWNLHRMKFNHQSQAKMGE